MDQEEGCRASRKTRAFGGPEEMALELEEEVAEAVEVLKSEDDELLPDLPDLLEEIRELMMGRHKKYGPGNISRHGMLGILVRIDDKLARLGHSTDDYEDEAYEDALMDVVGYGLIGIMYQRKQWPGSEG